jgi:signal transduction histidine kinase
MYIFAFTHTYKVKIFTPQSGGELTPYEIRTDREKVYAILTNLVKNAIKYTNRGSIEFGYNVVETQSVASLQFYVKDTGIDSQTEFHFVFRLFVVFNIILQAIGQGSGFYIRIGWDRTCEILTLLRVDTLQQYKYR